MDTVLDLGLDTGFQDTFFGHHKRGRATVAADFDLDGDVDFYLGNPGDESLLLTNQLTETGVLEFLATDLMLFDDSTVPERDLAWGAAAADYDNDGDYDLYISNGGNECVGFDKLLQNQWIESGETSLTFLDVTDEAGIKGPILPNSSTAQAMASGNGVWGDFNQDGWIDLFVNANYEVACGSLNDNFGLNTLWRNNGPNEDDVVTFTDVTDESFLRGSPVGSYSHKRPSRHSTFLDFDNDGDLDLYEQNARDDRMPGTEGDNVLWENIGPDALERWRFNDVTQQVSMLGSMGDLRRSEGSFASCAGDFNNDGWEDIMVFTRTLEDNSGDQGHYIFINENGNSFRELFLPIDSPNGVMGSQIGDINGDGVLDVFVGNGGPAAGKENRLFLSTLSNSTPNDDPIYQESIDLIDCPAPKESGLIYPSYPYRTHGTTMTDVDNDGDLELMISNGGPSAFGDDVREPNRLFDFSWLSEFNWIKIRPIGDGVNVSKDAIGTRLALTVREGSTGAPYTLHRTLFGGSCFSAQNGFDVFFGLGDADIIDKLDVTWPDNMTETIVGLVPGEAITITRE